MVRITSGRSRIWSEANSCFLYCLKLKQKFSSFDSRKRIEKRGRENKLVRQCRRSSVVKRSKFDLCSVWNLSWIREGPEATGHPAEWPHRWKSVQLRRMRPDAGGLRSCQKPCSLGSIGLTSAFYQRQELCAHSSGTKDVCFHGHFCLNCNRCGISTFRKKK